MQFKLTGTALILAATLLNWGMRVPAISGVIPRTASQSGLAPASATSPPFAYVAETCPSTQSCPSSNGLVQMLGGPAITAGIDNPTTLALDGSGTLYVGNANASSEGNISVYASQGVNPLRVLSGITGVPRGLVADSAGRLFAVAQYKEGCCQLGGDGEVYAPGGTEPRGHLKGVSGFGHSPVLDKSGNLYVANFSVFPGWVTVYAPGKHGPSRTINTGIGLPIQLAVAPNGDLVVLNGLFSGGYDVTVYPAGASSPSLTITAGLHRCASLAVDGHGNVYVGNGPQRKQPGEVTVYRAGQTTVSRSIQSGITYPAALAFDRSDRLYVADVRNSGASKIVIYAFGGSAPVQTYRLAEQFSAIAVPRSP